MPLKGAPLTLDGWKRHDRLVAHERALGSASSDAERRRLLHESLGQVQDARRAFVPPPQTAAGRAAEARQK